MGDVDRAVGDDQHIARKSDLAGGSVKILAQPKAEPAEPRGKNKRKALEAAKAGDKGGKGDKGEGKPKAGKGKPAAEAE